MGYDQYLSYSGRKAYECPSQYQHRYILKTQVPRDPRTSFFGSMIGKVFEWFYERSVWADPDPEAVAVSLIPEAVRFVLQDEGFSRSQDPTYVANVEEEVRDLVPKGVGVIRDHRLLSPNSRAEIDLTVNYTSQKHGMTVRLGGRTDFVHYQSPEDVWILDGKGSRHREKYVDSEQVIWYAVQHYLKYRVAPSRLGFLYWRFPKDPVQWIEYDEQSMRDSLDRTFDVVKRIRLKMFDPKPSSACHRCDYRPHCSEGTRYLAERRVETGGRIESSVFDLEQV